MRLVNWIYSVSDAIVSDTVAGYSQLQLGVLRWEAPGHSRLHFFLQAVFISVARIRRRKLSLASVISLKRRRQELNFGAKLSFVRQTVI